jgi:L-asparaginase
MPGKKVPKILLVFTGGTISMAKNSQGSWVPAKHTAEITNTFALMKKEACLDSHFVVDIDSSNMTPEIWQKIAAVIYAKYHQYDGFVITHGTDTLSYTTSALSFALVNLHKPVILTGAQKPISELGSDSMFNLFNSVKVAAHRRIREVALVFDTRIMRGNRSSKQYAQKIDAFWSPQYPLLGEIGVDIKYFPHKSPFSRPKKELKLQSQFSTRVISLSLFPGFEPHILSDIIEEKWYRGIIIRGFGPGNINTENELLSLIARATERAIPVLLISSCAGGTTILGTYETGQKAIVAGAISAADMTLETATVKLMWTLAQTNDMASIRQIMATNIAGEMGP